MCVFYIDILVHNGQSRIMKQEQRLLSEEGSVLKVRQVKYPDSLVINGHNRKARIAGKPGQIAQTDKCWANTATAECNHMNLKSLIPTSHQWPGLLMYL